MRQLMLKILFFFTPFCLTAQNDSLPLNQFLEKIGKMSFGGYGAMNYYHFAWQTDSVKRDAIDNERFILDFGYQWTPKIGLNTEIEFEHGGTGVEVEFDRFEEFGEFEFDVSKGGEVLIEQMNLEFNFRENMNLKIGRVKVPFALMFSRDEPTDYLTCINSEAETQILPENWTENGLLWFGKMGKQKRLQYYLAFVNGLDGTNFNSANWIKRGNQRRFEMVNAENFAVAGRVDFHFSNKNLIGASFYVGNSTGNRPKPDLRLETPILLTEIHFFIKKSAFQVAGMAFMGEMSNSEALSNQNRNLSNNLNVKRTPVGSAAMGGFAEFGCTFFGKNGLLKTRFRPDFLLFGRTDFYDTMFRTQGLIFNNPRWARQSITFGAVLKIINDVHFKTQLTTRKVGAPAPTSVAGGVRERTFVAGFAFEF